MTLIEQTATVTAHPYASDSYLARVEPDSDHYVLFHRRPDGTRHWLGDVTVAERPVADHPFTAGPLPARSVAECSFNYRGSGVSGRKFVADTRPAALAAALAGAEEFVAWIDGYR